jgi:hypothetical protein
MWCPNDKNDFFNQSSGQITPQGKVGQTIINYIKTEDIKNIVEIGTWNGMGSTRCFLLGLSSETKFYTIESNKEKVETAKKNLSSYFLTNNVKFLWGSILSIEDIKDPEIIFPELSNPEFKRWHSIDIENIRNSPNVISELPSKIDFLLLDGGEFTTWYEFQLLFSRCTQFIALDDVNVSKCKKIREYLKSHNSWIEIDYINERNGFSIFKLI